MRLDPERVIKLDAYLPESSLLTKLRGGVGGGGRGWLGITPLPGLYIDGSELHVSLHIHVWIYMDKTMIVCGPKGTVFATILLRNRVLTWLIFAILVSNIVWFCTVVLNWLDFF